MDEAMVVVARVLLSLIFLRGGYQAAKDPGGRVNKAARLRLPRPDLAVRVNGAAMVIGGLLLATSMLPTVGAIVLILSLIPTTLAGHAFWRESDRSGRDPQIIQFLKNTGLIAGLLFVIATA